MKRKGGKRAGRCKEGRKGGEGDGGTASSEAG